MTFERTADPELLKALVLKYPSIWNAITDDFSRAEYSPVLDDRIWYVLAIEDGAPFGFFAFFPQTAVCFDMHTVMPLNARSRIAMLGAIRWLWQQQPSLARVVTMVPSCNRIALRFGLRAGLEQYGRNPNSYMKGGQMCDQILLGVSRPLEV